MPKFKVLKITILFLLIYFSCKNNNFLNNSISSKIVLVYKKCYCSRSYFNGFPYNSFQTIKKAKIYTYRVSQKVPIDSIDKYKTL